MIPVNFMRANFIVFGVWFFVFMARHTGLLVFDSLSIIALISIFIFFISILSGSVLGVAASSETRHKFNTEYDPVSVNRFARYIIYIQIIAIFSLLIKHFDYFYLGSLDLYSITEQRLQRGREGDAIGSSIFGVIGFSLAGFFIIGFCYARYFYQWLNGYSRFILQLNLIPGMFLQALGGGRFGFVIFLIFLLFFVILGGLKIKKHLTLGKIVFLVFSVVSVLFVFHLIFVHRFIGDDYDQLSALLVVKERIVSAQPSGYLNDLLLHSDFSEVFFGVSMYIYYIGHSLSQLDLLLNTTQSQLWPLLFQYQLYPLFALLNYAGFSFIDIHEITATLPITGVYFSAIGGAYLDFGYVGMVPFFFFIALLGSYFSVKAIRNDRFDFLLLGSLYFSYLFFSPIITVINTAIFPSVLVASFFVAIFHPRPRYRHVDY